MLTGHKPLLRPLLGLSKSGLYSVMVLHVILNIKYIVNILKFLTLYFILFWPDFCFYAVVLKILSGMANSVDPDQTALFLLATLENIWD